MSKMHEVTTVIRRPNTELSHQQRLSNGFQSIGADDTNDKNNNQEQTNKNVLKKSPPPLPPKLTSKTKRSLNGIDSDNNAATVSRQTSTLSVKLPPIDDDPQKSLPNTIDNRSKLSTICAKGQTATHNDGATVRATITAPVSNSKTNCNTEYYANSTTSNECHHNGKIIALSLCSALAHFTIDLFVFCVQNVFHSSSDSYHSFCHFLNCTNVIH